ncbi:MAG TPA: hypothetical protein VFM27_03980 [Acidimicrobiales bacterium]|nr:hypothetical protein [Acidimicrobiales bacterium]
MIVRPRRWLAAVLCGAAIGSAGSCHKPPSAETDSYYMARNSPTPPSSAATTRASRAA